MVVPPLVDWLPYIATEQPANGTQIRRAKAMRTTLSYFLSRRGATISPRPLSSGSSSRLPMT